MWASEAQRNEFQMQRISHQTSTYTLHSAYCHTQHIQKWWLIGYNYRPDCWNGRPWYDSLAMDVQLPGKDKVDITLILNYSGRTYHVCITLLSALVCIALLSALGFLLLTANSPQLLGLDYNPLLLLLQELHIALNFLQMKHTKGVTINSAHLHRWLPGLACHSQLHI